MSEYKINPENHSGIAVTIGITDSDGLEHATQSLFPVSVQLFDENIHAQSYTEDLTAMIEPLIKDCVARITRIADLNEEERKDVAEIEDRQRFESGDNYFKEFWDPKLTKH